MLLMFYLQYTYENKINYFVFFQGWQLQLSTAYILECRVSTGGFKLPGR